ncbi:MAG: hypothetical protein FJ126_08885 [Deltaproteobacteria bacterium]|nr:hypothetical protein [Deltaproteobacteria bacterium]
MLPADIYNLITNVLDEISDECNEEELCEGYLIKYEGWSIICFENVWTNFDLKVDDEIDEYFYNYAEEQSYLTIEEWKLQLENRFYDFIDGGYYNRDYAATLAPAAEKWFWDLPSGIISPGNSPFCDPIAFLNAR